MKDINQITATYHDFSKQSRDISNSIAKSISMLQLDEVNEGIVSAVQQIESLANKGKDKSLLASIPFFGKYAKKVADKADEEILSNSNVVKVIDRLFDSLTAKKENIDEVVETLFTLQEKLEQEVAIMKEQEADILQIIDQGTKQEQYKAKNLLAQVTQSIIKTQDRIQVITGTVASAERSTIQISSLLPQLQGEIVAEMTIQAGLQELKDFKQVFDTTVDIVEGLSSTNNASMKQVLLDVVDLSVTRTSDVKRLENISNDADNFRKQLQDKMNKAHKRLDDDTDTLLKIRNQSNLLENKNVYSDE